jgi:hypothetical protein
MSKPRQMLRLLLNNWKKIKPDSLFRLILNFETILSLTINLAVFVQGILEYCNTGILGLKLMTPFKINANYPSFQHSTIPLLRLHQYIEGQQPPVFFKQ